MSTAASSEGRYPTPQEFVTEWDALADADRLNRAARIIDALQRSHDCFLRNHDGLEAERQRLHNALASTRIDAAEELQKRFKPS